MNDCYHFNPIRYFIRFDGYPYETGRRFSGLLAHLFYSNYKDEYEEMFEIVIGTIKRNFETTMPLVVFLRNFVKENDISKLETVNKLIADYKEQNPQFDWSKKLSECYRYSTERCIVGKQDITLKEMLEKDSQKE